MMNKKILKLNLMRGWFDLFLAKLKKDEYREIKPYWCHRFLLEHGESLSCKRWEYWFKELKDIGKNPIEIIERGLEVGYFQFKVFDEVEFANGYRKDRDIFLIELISMGINRGDEEFGAKVGVKYFVLSCGDILSKKIK